MLGVEHDALFYFFILCSLRQLTLWLESLIISVGNQWLKGLFWCMVQSLA